VGGAIHTVTTDQWSFITGLIGAVCNLAAAAWLLFGFPPADFAEPGTFGVERHDKGVRLSLIDAKNVQRLLRGQRKPIGLIVLGSALQLTSIALAAA
jgi:hypothetical protein